MFFIASHIFIESKKERKKTMKGIVGLLKAANKYGGKNAPALLTGGAIAGVVVTSILSSIATVKTKQQFEKKKEEFDELEDFERNLHKFKIVAKNYAPAVAVGASTIASIVYAHRIQSRRLAVVAGLYKVTNDAYKDYRNEVSEIFGEKKEKLVDSGRHERRLNAEEGYKDVSEILSTGGDTLCYDVMSGRYFRGSIEEINSAISQSNHLMYSSDWVSLNDVYDLIGLPPIELGNDVGWSIEDGPIEGNFSSILKDTTPALVIDFRVRAKVAR